jgi:hypothetical protein
MPELTTTDDVCKVLRSLGHEYTSYANTFKKNDIDGYWFLNHTDEDKLIKYGVENKDHRQFILEKIEELREKCRTKYLTSQN